MQLWCAAWVSVGNVRHRWFRDVGWCVFGFGFGVWLAGFPRNLDNLVGWMNVVGTQANVAMVLFLDCPERIMEERLLKRGETSGRSDDNIESIRKRFHTYKDESLPIIHAFEARGKVRHILTDKSIDEVWTDVSRVMKDLQTATSSATTRWTVQLGVPTKEALDRCVPVWCVCSLLRQHRLRQCCTWYPPCRCTPDCVLCACVVFGTWGYCFYCVCCVRASVVFSPWGVLCVLCVLCVGLCACVVSCRVSCLYIACRVSCVVCRVSCFVVDTSQVFLSTAVTSTSVPFSPSLLFCSFQATTHKELYSETLARFGLKARMETKVFQLEDNSAPAAGAGSSAAPAPLAAAGDASKKACCWSVCNATACKSGCVRGHCIVGTAVLAAALGLGYLYLRNKK